MEAQEVLDEILDHACPSNEDENGTLIYVETHCVGHWITAHRDDATGHWTVKEIKAE